MKLILSYLKPYRFSALTALFLTFAELGTDLVLPLILAKMINEGVLYKDIGTVVYWGAIMIGLALISLLAGIGNSFYASYASMGFSHSIRSDLFSKIQHFAFKNLSRFPASGLVTRFTNDVRQIQNTIFMGLRIMAKAPLTIIGGIAMAFVVDAGLAAVFLITVPAALLFLAWVLQQAGKRFSRVQNKVDDVNRVMQENLSGMRLIRAFARRPFEEKRFQRANTELASETRKTFRFVEASMPVLLVLMNATLIFIIWFGHKETMQGSTSVGNVVAIVNYALRISIMVSTFTFITLAFSRAKASAERLQEVFSIEDGHRTEQVTKRAPKNGSIAFQDVSFSYPNTEKVVLRHVSFDVQNGERIAIMGATGSGKTSLFQLIPGLFEPDSGSIELGGTQLIKYDLEALRKQIGFVPQEAILFSGTIRENICFGKHDATEAEMTQAAKDAQIHDLIAGLPAGYDTVIGQRGVNLSGGQKQRLSIARALLIHPLILMLDDSTSALDMKTESQLLEALDRYRCTTLMITQKIRSAEKADRILLLEDGAVLAFGTHAELLEQSALYRSIAESQGRRGAQHG